MRLSTRLGVSTLALIKGQWFDGAALMDADFTNNRYRYDGANYGTLASFIAAIGGVAAATGQQMQYEVGPYVAPDAPELLPDGRFDVTGVGAWVGSAATVAVAGNELSYTASAANSPGARRPLNPLIASPTGRAYRAKGKIRRGTVASTSIGFGIGGAGTFNFSGSQNLTADALTDAEVFCGGFDAGNASIVLRTNANPVTGTAYAAEISLKEALPFKSFKVGEVSGVIEATTPAATGTQRVVWQLDDAAINGGGIIERNFIRLVWTAAGNLALVVSSGNTAAAVEQANLDLGPMPASTAFKVAFSAKLNDFRAAIVGRPVVADTSGIFPGVCGMRLGKAREVSNNLWTGGSIQRIRLYPFAMDANAFLAIAAGSQGIAAWGDSLTAGAGATGGSGGTNTYPFVASGLFSPSRLVANMGSGGQTSTQIAARLGGWPIAVTVAGDTIPASGPVAVPAKNINILFNSGLFTGQQTGWIAGVKGVLTTDGDGNWTFTRSVAGDAVAVAAGVQFVPELAESLRACTAWLWLGRNGAQGGYTVEGDIAASVTSLRHDRYFVMSPLVPTAAGDPSTLNARLAATYGTRFANVLAELQSHGNGGTDDNADIAAGIVPRSLRSDGVHLNDAGYAYVAAFMVAKQAAAGW